VAAILILLAIACHPVKEDMLSEESLRQLETRVRERWLALEKRDFNAAWEYTTPNYRISFPKSLYSRNFSYAVNWELTGIEVVNYDAVAAVASVAVRVMSEPTKQTSVASRAVGAVPVIFHEQWLKTDGEWWYSANR
jgi:hypothetical protein